GGVCGGGIAGRDLSDASIAVDTPIVHAHEFEAELHAVPSLQPRYLVLKTGSPSGRNSVDVAAEIAEFRDVLAIVGRFVRAHSGNQRGFAISVVQGQIGSLSQVPLVVAEGEVIQHGWLDDVVAVQAVVLGIAEFLEGFGQGAR